MSACSRPSFTALNQAISCSHSQYHVRAQPIGCVLVSENRRFFSFFLRENVENNVLCLLTQMLDKGLPAALVGNCPYSPEMHRLPCITQTNRDQFQLPLQSATRRRRGGHSPTLPHRHIDRRTAVSQHNSCYYIKKRSS